MRRRTFFILVSVILTGVLIYSCQPAERSPLSYLYTAEHHTHTGIKLLKQGKYDDSEREFRQALRLSPEFSKAHAGLSLVSAYEGDFQSAFGSMSYALNYAKTKEDAVFAHVCAMRIFTMERSGAGWLEDVTSQYEETVKLDPHSSAACYFMGMAYKVGLEFDKSGRMFAKVLDFNDEYVEEADREWKLMSGIMKMMPLTVPGKKIAIKESITRADAAALFVDELKIDDMYERAEIRSSEKQTFMATDIDDHPMKIVIEVIQDSGVKGLEQFPDRSFRPDDLVTRAAFAVMIEDIFAKTMSDAGHSATLKKGGVSSFPDLRSDHPAFGAVKKVTDEGIMHARNLTTGEFSPLGPVSGVDALLIIKKLKEKLMVY